FPDIMADAGCGLGVFDNIHGFPDAAAFAKELRTRATTYFGAAADAYLRRLALDRHLRLDWLVNGSQRAMARYRAMSPADSAADGRIADNFAVVYAAGMLARRYDI